MSPSTDTLAHRTRKMLDRLVIITVNTGLWTAILAIIDLILVIGPQSVQFLDR